MIDGEEIIVDHVKPLSGGGDRIDVEASDRTWRVDVTSTGTKEAIVSSWHNGQLAELDEPDWLDDALARLARTT